MTYKELRELIKEKPDEEEVIVLHIEEDNYYYTLDNFIIDGNLVIGGER